MPGNGGFECNRLVSLLEVLKYYASRLCKNLHLDMRPTHGQYVSVVRIGFREACIMSRIRFGVWAAMTFILVPLGSTVWVTGQSNRQATFQQVAELTASDGRPSDLLGYSLAFDGDTVVAGATQYSVNGTGKAYVFVKPASGWANATQTAELTPSDGVPDLGFGYHVAISGNTIVVDSAPLHAGVETRAEYVFVRPTAGWTNMTETARLTLPVASGLGSVAISGNTIAVGAGAKTIGGNYGQGAVYLYVRPQSGWNNQVTPKVRLSASDGLANDSLGFSLAFDGNTIVAGTSNRAAYVFVKPSGGWVTANQTAELTAPNADSFGWSVSLSGGTILVGAPGTGGSYGAAYFYYEPPTGWANATDNAEIMASDAADENFFGTSVAVSGRFAAVGAVGANIGSNNLEGAVYAFDGVTQVSKITPSQGLAGEEMGNAIAAVGSTVVAGALYANSQQGILYVFAP